jgi:predicted ribosomally synthesized peptide with nif11-like leader
MDQKELELKLEQLNNNPEFKEKLEACETAEEMAALFCEEGIEVTAEQLTQAVSMVTAQNSDGELDEDALENVSGGILMESLCAAWMIANIMIAGGQILKSIFKKK